jgi:putative GTP pyrophosphokinase
MSDDMIRFSSDNLPAFVQETLLTQAENLVDKILDIKNMMMEYSCAIKEIKTKLEVLDTEFSVKYSRNPISSIHTRLKSQSSIIEKMKRKNIPITRENIQENLNDIAGLRVICSYIDDIYSLAEALTVQDDIRLIEKKDYISNPKPNGYRSLHLIVAVPVFFSDEKKWIKAEVQIRTIAMDFWASLEHGIKYKKSAPDAEEIISDLKECADIIAATDEKMMVIRQKMDATKVNQSEEEKIYEKLKKVDVPF